jgi:5-methyltetrahydropteroyltriglutamate--homocysteine methyltransferase
MELILANHSSYPRIGDDGDHQLLRRTIAQRDKGEKTDEDVRQAENRLTELALKEQIDAGLEVVTDGQIRWYDPISHFAGKLQGVRINGLLRFFDTNFYFRQPVVFSKPGRSKPLVVEEFRFAQAKSARQVKPVLTGPYTLARYSMEEGSGVGGFSKLLEAYTEALAAEVAALGEAGATLIQIEEPALLKFPEDFSLVAQGMAALAARRGPAQLAIVVHFGDPTSVYDRLQTLPADILGLDFTYNPNLVQTVAARGASRVLAVGLVDGRNTKLEDVPTVARHLEQIARGTGARQAFLTTSCGLEYLPRDRAQLKLKHLGVIKREFLGRGE